jgi:transposase
MWERLTPLCWYHAVVVNRIARRNPMHPTSRQPAHAAPHLQSHDATLYASLELSRATWLVTSLSPGSEKMSKHSMAGGDGKALVCLLARLRAKAEDVTGRSVRIAVIQEAGLDGFWVHRLLETNGIESHVVDPASIAVPRRHRRAKTDAIDGETMLRTLLAWKRGEPRVCSMVVPPSPEQEDRRRICRERSLLQRERVRHVNRIKGLLAGQGITGYEPLRRDRLKQLDELRTGDGRPLPSQLKAELLREIEMIELLMRQIAEVEAERDAAVEPEAESQSSPIALLARLKAIGPQIAAVLYLEGLYRTYTNRREVAAYAGLVPTPWRSGTIDRDQGISKAGNRRLRTTLIELAWLWVRHQPDSALSRWFRARVGAERGRVRRIAVVALARKLLIALWRYVTHGEVPEGAVLKAT